MSAALLRLFDSQYSTSTFLPKSERTFYRFFDTSVFVRPALGSVGSAPRNSFRGPGINDWDVSVKRMFRIKERARIEFRIDSYNFFNHTQFSGLDATARFDASGAQINQQDVQSKEIVAGAIFSVCPPNVSTDSKFPIWFYRRPFILWPLRPGTLTHVTLAEGKEVAIKRTPVHDPRLEQGTPEPPTKTAHVPEVWISNWWRRLRRR